MAKPLTHALVGAVAAVAPDVALALFYNSKKWLPETHPLVRTHRFLHSPAFLVVIFVVGWLSHILVDKVSKHRTEAEWASRLTTTD